MTRKVRKDMYTLTDPPHRRVLELMANGLVRSEIGAELQISAEAVLSRQKKIYRQLGARNAAHAVHLAHQRGLLGEAPPAEVVPAA